MKGLSMSAVNGLLFTLAFISGEALAMSSASATRDFHPNFSRTTSIKVVFVAGSALFRNRLDEKALLKIGCVFSINSPQDIKELVDLIIRKIHPTTKAPSRLEKRTAVYFEEDGKQTSVLLFDKAYTNLKSVEASINHQQQTEATKQLPDLIARWTKERGLKQFNANCNIN